MLAPAEPILIQNAHVMLEDVDVRVMEMYAGGMGLPGIAGEIGRSQCFVHGRLKKAGVQMRPPGNPRKERPERRTPADRLEDGVRRYLAGESAKSIERSGLASKVILLNELRSRGIEIRMQAKGDDAAIVTAYLGGLSVSSISETIGCTKRRATNVLKAAGVPLRKRTAEKTAASRLAASKRRMSAVARATPPWADRDAIKLIYARCREVKSSTGVDHHVDHVYPLRGELVSGLHVPGNLEIVTERQNIAKKNKVDPKLLEWIVHV